MYLIRNQQFIWGTYFYSDEILKEKEWFIPRIKYIEQLSKFEALIYFP